MLKRKGKDSSFPTDVHFNAPNVLMYQEAAIAAPTACLGGNCWVSLTTFKLKPMSKGKVAPIATHKASF